MSDNPNPGPLPPEMPPPSPESDVPAPQPVPLPPDTVPPQEIPPGVMREIGGAKGPEPTRYGDWEHKGRCSDF